MSENTKKLLTDLGANPNLVEKFKADPKKVMDQYDVPDDHQELINSGDKEGLIQEADLGEEHAQFIVV
ncbi:MAG: hypothetical protein AAGJ52_03425 [Pseudomonadota bacterium]